MPPVPKLIHPESIRTKAGSSRGISWAKEARRAGEIAGVAELVDAKDLKSFDPKRVVRVQVPPSARHTGD
jgi:hypothetical protein